MSSGNSNTITIPDNLESCQALIEQLSFTIGEQSQKIESLEQKNQELKLSLDEVLRQKFGTRSERYIEDPKQLKLDFPDMPGIDDAVEGLAEAVEESEQVIPEHKRRRRKRKRRNEQLPEHLPRKEFEADVPDDLKHCATHGERQFIGYDTVESLEFERPKLWVRVTKYPKYACPSDAECGVKSPERPVGLVAGNRYAPSVAAEVITGKYGYHLPIYRQQDYFAGSGWTPTRSTLLNLLEASAFVIRPLAEHIKQIVLGSGILGTDDTSVTLLLPKQIPKPVEGDPKSIRIHQVLTEAKQQNKPSVSAHLWAYRSVTLPLQVFDFTVSWHRDGPELFLSEFCGKLMADCYAGYQGIALNSGGRIQRGSCVAHARRKVYAARDGYPLESSLLLSQFQQLYDLEDRAKMMSAEERLALRQQEATPIWDAMHGWLASDAAGRVTPKSKLGQALGYLRNHWDPLRLYLTDGLLPIDNNDVEQLMKQVALGRKNWLFIGSVPAGERAADFLTLVSSAVRNDLDVYAYLQDVLETLLAGSTDYASLRPDAWKTSHPESIRSYRVDERRDRADRKQRLRAARRQAAR